MFTALQPLLASACASDQVGADVWIAVCVGADACKAARRHAYRQMIHAAQHTIQQHSVTYSHILSRTLEADLKFHRLFIGSLTSSLCFWRLRRFSSGFLDAHMRI